MIAPAASSNAVFSTDVELDLEFGAETHSVSAVGPERFVLTHPQQLMACDAVLLIRVNGEPRRVPIRIAGSASPEREFVYSLR